MKKNYLTITLITGFLCVGIVHATESTSKNQESAQQMHKKNNPNSNGHFSEDKKTGLERAKERMSDEGKEHNKAHGNEKRHKKNKD
jgi:hypothetical protein